MLKIVSALEIKASGIFKDREAAKGFNKKVGEVLHLHRLRTTLSLDEFKLMFFQPGGEGRYLEDCCGKGNVDLKVTTPPFLAVHGVVGSSHERKVVYKKYKAYESNNKWDRTIHNKFSLLSWDEIEKYALNPFKIILVRDFGEVNPKNIELLKNRLAESAGTSLLFHK